MPSSRPQGGLARDLRTANPVPKTASGAKPMLCAGFSYQCIIFYPRITFSTIFPNMDIFTSEARSHSLQSISMWQPSPLLLQPCPTPNTYHAGEINSISFSKNTSRIFVISTKNGMQKSMVASDSNVFKKSVNDSVPAATTSKESLESSAPIRNVIMNTFVLSAAKDSISVPHAVKSGHSCSQST